MRRQHDGTSRLGTFFFLMGCVAVLVVTFAGGVVTGRYWTRSAGSSAIARPSPPRDSAPAPAAPAVAAVDPATKAPSGGAPAVPPRVTFYQELTAPLAPPPPPAPARPPAKPAPAPPAEAPKPERPLPPARSTSPANTAGETRYTVQIGAYRDRGQAEALRASLAAAGHDAYVSEADGTGPARYRVRVGSFPTRQAAIDAATRLGSERQVATYVTTR